MLWANYPHHREKLSWVNKFLEWPYMTIFCLDAAFQILFKICPINFQIFLRSFWFTVFLFLQHRHVGNQMLIIAQFFLIRELNGFLIKMAQVSSEIHTGRQVKANIIFPEHLVVSTLRSDTSLFHCFIN